MRSEYKHYRNFNEPGFCGFFTTTCLNFAHAFGDERTKNLMAASLLDDLRYYGATLHAYVVMSHHIHFLAYPPEGKTPSWLMDRVKSNSARRVLPHVSDRVRTVLAEQSGLNDRVFWKVGFRSFGVLKRETFGVKARYIHRNPVRAGWCSDPSDYSWSSARLYEQGLWTPERGIVVSDDMIRQFAAPEELSLKLIRAAELVRD